MLIVIQSNSISTAETQVICSFCPAACWLENNYLVQCTR